MATNKQHKPIALTYSEPKDSIVIPNADLTGGFNQMGMKKVTDGLQSDNYSAGASGWKINQNGASEFQAVTIGGYVPDGGAANDVNVGSTKISGGQIVTGSVTANQINVTDLFAQTITATGSITGATITGGTVRTSSSGARVQILSSTDTLQILDSGSVVRAESFQNGWQFNNSSGGASGKIFIENTFGNLEVQATGGDLFLTASNDITFAPGNGSISMYLDGTTHKSFFNYDIDMSGNSLSSVNRVTGTSGYIDYSAGTQIYTNTRFAPVTTNVYDLGATNKIWQDIYVGNVHYNSLILISDERRKKNISHIKYGLKEILELKPVSFNYKEQLGETMDTETKQLLKKDPEGMKKSINDSKSNCKRDSKKKHLGFIAQSVQPILPELVLTDNDGGYSLNSVEMIPVLVQAIKDLSKEIKLLK